MASDYCDLCELPLSTCVHGMPPEPKEPPKPVAVKKPRAAAKKTASAPVRQVARRFTPPEAIAPHVLAVLDEAGGELDADDAFSALEQRLEADFLAGDKETTPEGELRWQYAARRARQLLVTDGLMSKGRPGVWELTDAGGSAARG